MVSVSRSLTDLSLYSFTKSRHHPPTLAEALQTVKHSPCLASPTILLTVSQELSWTVIPLLTGRKGERKLFNKFTMRNDQIFGQPDLIETSERQHDHTPDLMPSFYDILECTMMPTTFTPSTDWDTSEGTNIDLGSPPYNVSDTTSVSFGSLHIDWNSEPSLFEDPQEPPFWLGSGFPQTAQPDPDVPLSWPLGLSFAGAEGCAAMSSAPYTPLLNPSTLKQSADGLNRFLLSELSQNSVLEGHALVAATKASSSAVTNLQPELSTLSGDITRQSTIINDMGNTTAPNRTLTPLLATTNPLPLMGSSSSECCNKRARTKKRPLLPKLAPVPPVSQTSNGSKSGSTPPEWPVAKRRKTLLLSNKGRCLPRLTIPEGRALQHSPTPAPVKFTIDSNGKAHVKRKRDAADEIRIIRERHKKSLNPKR